MNINKLREVQAVILSDAQHFDMRDWGSARTKPRGKFMGHDLGFVRCGTVACIAGWAVLLEGGDPAQLRVGDSGKVGIIAQALLGLSNEQKDELFYIESWPDDLQARYEMADSANDKPRMAAVAAEAIDRFIEKYQSEEWQQELKEIEPAEDVVKAPPLTA